jgi:iron uptake system component EfeO
MRTGRTPWAVSGVAGVVGLSLMATGCTSSRATSRAGSAASGASTVDISVSHCGRGWSGGPTGTRTFTLRDIDSGAAEVTLVAPSTGAVYAALEPLGAGRTAAMTVRLGPGSYAFRCAVEDQPVVTGPTVVLRGPAPAEAAVAVQPVTSEDLLPATGAYTSYVAGRLPALLRDVDRLTSDLRRHDRATAERDWLTAHLEYERLGAAYRAFGTADAAINGLPVGGPEALRDNGFTGFHRLELDLWHGASYPRLLSESITLARDVRRLHTSFASAQIDPSEVSIRAHEIAENALQVELTGRSDLGSHTSLATVDANLGGTQTLLTILAPLLRPRYAALAQATAQLARARADVAAQDRRGRWTPLASLSRAARQRIDADVSELCELLAPVATILEPRRST